MTEIFQLTLTLCNNKTPIAVARHKKIAWLRGNNVRSSQVKSSDHDTERRAEHLTEWVTDLINKCKIEKRACVCVCMGEGVRK